MPNEAKRDPRVDPKSGDVFAGADGRVREVVCIANYVVYRFQFGWKKYHLLMHSWRKWAKNAKVLHAAD